MVATEFPNNIARANQEITPNKEAFPTKEDRVPDPLFATAIYLAGEYWETGEGRYISWE